jgi:hypothetical protein
MPMGICVTTKRLFVAFLVALAVLPAAAHAQRTSTLRTLIDRVELPPITDGDRYVLLGDTPAPVFAVYDTVTKRTRALSKPAGCSWSGLPRGAHFGRLVLYCPTGPLLVNLRSGATRPLPVARSYAVGRRWLAAMDAQSVFYLNPRTNEVRRSTGPRDLDHARLRRVCGRLRRGGGPLPDSDNLAYDRTRHLAMTSRGLLLRPCNRRRRAVRLQRGNFAGLQLPDYATLSSGLVTWTSLREPDRLLGYDARRKRRWEWFGEEGAVPMHTRNALLVRTPVRFLTICESEGCAVLRWRAELAPISRAKPRRSARGPARRRGGRGRRS